MEAHLRLARIILASLIGLALVLGPIGAADAAQRQGMASKTTATDTMHSGHGDHAVDQDVADAMPDCHKMGQASGLTDCPCCDVNKACPPDLCAYKCFKVFGLFGTPERKAPGTASLQFAHRSERPPDWGEAPQPPPPRT